MSKTDNTERTPLEFGARGKRRSESQRVGKKGERLFEEWAEDHSIVANKCSDDYGIDYFCQGLLSPTTKYLVEETRGDVFAAQVRSVKGVSRLRIKMDKVDAEAALRVEAPYVLIGVDASKRTVYYRFLDNDLAQDLANFIAAEEAQLTFSLDSADFRTADFRNALTHHCLPGVQHRLRIFCTELCIQREVPGARLHITHSSSGGFALIEVPWITSIFHVPPEEGNRFRRLVFEQGTLPDQGTSGIGIHPSIFKALDVAGTDQLIIRGAFEHEFVATVSLEGRTARLAFTARAAGNETGFISGSGLVLTFSDAMPATDGRFYHKLSFTLNRAHGKCLDAFSEFDPAIRLLKLGSKISFQDDGTHPIDASCWGAGFEHLGDGYEQILDGCAFAGISLKGIQLGDLLEEEFARSIWLLSSFADGQTIDRIMPGFLLGPAADDPNWFDRCKRMRFEVPVVMNVKSCGVILWISGEANVYIHEGRACGFIPLSQSACRPEVRNIRFPSKSIAPEVWLCTYWPAIELSGEPENSREFVAAPECEHEYGGRLFPLA